MAAVQDSAPPVETFTPEETTFLSQYVTNVDKPVFALINLPEVVKGALFARYSRSEKSLRRLLLDEFRGDVGSTAQPSDNSPSRATSLYARVFADFGDDSIAQLGSVHVALEGVSNIATKLVERGRLMSYLEQSTRYVPYTDRPGGRWKYHTPAELADSYRDEYRRVADSSFATYAALLPRLEIFLGKEFLTPTEQSDRAAKRATRAKALDLLRGLLPASTRSNVGVFGSGQSYEYLIMRLRASGNSEAEALAELLLLETQKVIPAFLSRVDRPDRGRLWTNYLERTQAASLTHTQEVLQHVDADSSPEVDLVDFDPQGEIKVVAAAMYPYTSLPDRQLLSIAERMTVAERLSVLQRYVGNRANRRHKPGRAFERTSYRFDILGDYGAFRDLQRHRLLTLEWQTLTTAHGYDTPLLVNAAGAGSEWHEVMEQSSRLHDLVVHEYSREVASYGVPMAFKIRYIMDMNAREAMHVIELRSAEQGHESYRRVALQMHSLIAQKAGHNALAQAMTYANYTATPLERLQAERNRDTKNAAI